MKTAYQWFARLSVFSVPLAFFGTFACYIVFYSKSLVSSQEGNLADLEHYSHLVDLLSTCIGYLTTVTNIVSCTILVLVLRFANKLAKKTEITSI